MTVEVLEGDSAKILPTLEAESFDAGVTDPPYHLTSIVKRFGKAGSRPPSAKGATGVYKRAAKGFMGKQWDGGDIAFRAEFWAEVLRVLKPGAHLLAFGGSRTYHRMACAVEDAGFEIRDQIMWLYGSGFPKSHNLKGDWEGWGTALKPAHEPILVARKPVRGTVAGNVARHRTGALNIDGSRIEMSDDDRDYIADRISGFNETRSIGGNSAYSGGKKMDRSAAYDGSKGRWPANVVHDGSPDVVESFARYGDRGPGYWSGETFGFQTKQRKRDRGERFGTDSGTAARFFYCAKAGEDDRMESEHPTVKPVALMRWLVRLVTPPKGRVLDPFAGTGTTGMACLREGFDCLLIEREDQYLADIRRRLEHVSGADTPLFGGGQAGDV